MLAPSEHARQRYPRDVCHVGAEKSEPEESKRAAKDMERGPQRQHTDFLALVTRFLARLIIMTCSYVSREGTVDFLCVYGTCTQATVG